MKEAKIKKIHASIRKSIYKKSHRIVSESEFWKITALQQQVLIHAKNKT